MTTAKIPEKYQYRYEQILHYIILCGEIPVCLYKTMGIKYNNFRQQIYNLTLEGKIIKNTSNRTSGYRLSTASKQMLAHNIKYAKYGNKYEEPKNHIDERRRMHNFAEIYAALDRVNSIPIHYEEYIKPHISEISSDTEELMFYTAKEIKSELGTREIQLRGCRAYGLLAGKNRYYTVYKTKQDYPEFTSREENWVIQVGKMIKEVNNRAIMLCDDLQACINICNNLAEFKRKKIGVNITNSSYYRELILIPTYDKTELQMWTLYHQKELYEQLNKKLKLSNKKTRAVCDGYTEQNEMVLYVLNIDVARLLMFLNQNRTSKGLGYLVCYDYMINDLKKLITQNNNIKIIGIDSERIERLYE